ncbi:8311_t:CDS:2 [Funneliformis mosseae]|uniref:8311_t:CDS:1 n=1 Tax=Funneliformis mosseae TaxID=27381 RepID=A0A9N9BJF3_FUNMO|nr:8311_t:CDS:2 [Funneliformis mosseae]
MGHEIFILEQEIDVIDKPHNGSPITMMEISPNAKYIITYSEKDKTIVGWNVDDEEGQLKPDCTIKSDKIFRFNKTEEIDEEDEKKIFHMCVSDEKKLVLSYVEYGSHIEGIGSKDIHEYLKIIDMKNQNQETELYFKFIIDRFYCSFNSKGEFILYNIIEKSLSIPMFGNDKKKSYNRISIIWIYSTQTKKWECQEIYEVPQGVELINISQHDKIRLRLNNNIYERSISDDTTMSKLSKNLCEIKSKDIKMSSNEGFIYLKINDEITVYSTEPETPIASFDLKVENHDKIYEFLKQHNGLHCLLLSLFDYNSIHRIKDSIIKRCQNLCSDHSIEILTSLPSLIYDYQSKRYIFVIIDGYVWKINFDELEFDELELVSKEFEANDVTESWNAYFGNENDNNEYEDPFIPCENIDRSKLFRKATVKYESKDIKLEIYTNIRMTGFIGLRVFENDNVIERIKKTKCKKTIDIYKVKIFNSKEIIILTSIGIFIFHLNQDDLILNHFLNICLSDVELKCLVDETFWVSHEETDRYNFLKYSVELITAIRERDIESVDGIYKKCLDYFKRDLVNNKAFLSIITNSISLLNRYYPEYIIKYSSDTNMIIDSLDYNIERLNISHLHPFEGIKLVNLTPSLAWTKYNYLLKRIVDKSNGILHGIMLFILSCQYVLCAYSLPISFLTFNILDRFHIVNNIVKYDMSAYFYYSLSYTSSKPTITFMIPYIKFVSYPEDYDWIEELFHPQPSPFIETISNITTKTTNALSIFRHHDPAPATEAVIREFKLWIQYANAAYYDVKGWECDVCKGDTDGTRLIEIFPFSSQRNNGYVAINDEKKAIIVAYSGTTDDPSLLLDYKIVQVPYSPSVPNAMVHSGFMIFYHATKEGITSLTKNLVKEYPSYKVITTGHSLGGVLATFQTLDLIGTPGLNPSNLFTYTYGEPRSGNKEFAQFIMNSGYKFFRLVDKGDIIPHLPPNYTHYTHYGPEFWMNPKNEIVVCQKADDKRCSNSILVKNLEDHDIDTYVKDLSAM